MKAGLGGHLVNPSNKSEIESSTQSRPEDFPAIAMRHGEPAFPEVFSISAGAVVRSLAIVSATLVSISMLTRLAGLEIGRLDVDVENSVPTLWSVQLLFLLAILLGIRGFLGRRTGEPQTGWVIVVLAAVFVGLDEGLAVHEELIEPVRGALGTGGLLYQAWMIPYAVLVLLGGLALVPWFRSIEPHLRNRLFGAAGIFLLGAFGSEAIGGVIIDSGGFDSAGYTVVVSIEEALEMAGVIYAIAALLRSVSKQETAAFALRA